MVMLRLLLLSVIIFSLGLSNGFGQVVFESPYKKGQKTRSSNFSFSFQVSYGSVSPTVINSYINQQVQNQMSSGWNITRGNPNITTSPSLNIAPTVKLNSHWKLRIPLEYGFGSRTVSVNTNSTRYTMNRFSPGVIAYYYTTAGDNTSFFTGIGPLGHFMSFENSSSSTIGGRLELGFSWTGKNSDREILIMYTSAKGSTNANPSEIDFSGLSFGIRVTFN